MPLGLVLTRRGEVSIAKAEAWWRRHRDAADALAVELDQTLAFIRDRPNAGQLKRTRYGKQIRRYTLEQTRYYIYYRIISGAVEVILLWHTSRRPPRL